MMPHTSLAVFRGQDARDTNFERKRIMKRILLKSIFVICLDVFCTTGRASAVIFQ
jgi:hypothetical protein